MNWAIVELALRAYILTMDGQPPEVRAELWRIFLEDMRAWRAFWLSIFPPAPAADDGRRLAREVLERADQPGEQRAQLEKSLGQGQP